MATEPQWDGGNQQQGVKAEGSDAAFSSDLLIYEWPLEGTASFQGDIFLLINPPQRYAP